MCQPIWTIEFLLVTIFYAIFCYVIPSIVFLPIYIFKKNNWYSIEKKFYSFTAIALSVFHKRTGTRIKAFGEVEELREGLSSSANNMFVVMVNHQTPVDISILSSFWQGIDPGTNHFGAVSWIQDFILKFLPTGWVSKVHGDYFLLQPTNINGVTKCMSCESSSKKIKSGTTEGIKKWVRDCVKRHRIIQFFPEGGFLLARRESSKKFARIHDLPELDRMALPRPSGFASIVDELNKISPETKKQAKFLVCLTIAYPDQENPLGPADVFMKTPNFGCGKTQMVYIHCKIEPFTNVPLPEKTSNLISQKEQSIYILKNTSFGRFFIQKIVEMNNVLETFYGINDIGKSVDIKISTLATTLTYLVTCLFIITFFGSVVVLPIYLVLQ